MKQAQNPSSSQLSAMLLDPAINLMFCHMKQEMDQLKSKLEQAQNDLAAWKFTPDRYNLIGSPSMQLNIFFKVLIHDTGA